jgi:hypothetical protein
MFPASKAPLSRRRPACLPTVPSSALLPANPPGMSLATARWNPSTARYEVDPDSVGYPRAECGPEITEGPVRAISPICTCVAEPRPEPPRSPTPGPARQPLQLAERRCWPLMHRGRCPCTLPGGACPDLDDKVEQARGHDQNEQVSAADDRVARDRPGSRRFTSGRRTEAFSSQHRRKAAPHQSRLSAHRIRTARTTDCGVTAATSGPFWLIPTRNAVDRHACEAGSAYLPPDEVVDGVSLTLGESAIRDSPTGR